jgi:hypothetical protein
LGDDARAQLNYWRHLLCHLISVVLPGKLPQLRRAEQQVRSAVNDFSSQSLTRLPSSSSSTLSCEIKILPSAQETASSSKASSNPLSRPNPVPPLAIVSSSTDSVTSTYRSRHGTTQDKTKQRVATTKLDLTSSTLEAYDDRRGRSHAANEWQSLFDAMYQLQIRLSSLTSMRMSKSSKKKARKGIAGYDSESGDEETSLLQLSCIHWLLNTEWFAIRKRIHLYVNIYSDLSPSVSLYQIEQVINSLLTRKTHIYILPTINLIALILCYTGVPSESLLHNVSQICRETVQKYANHSLSVQCMLMLLFTIHISCLPLQIFSRQAVIIYYM